MRKNVASQVVAFQMISATDGSDVTSGTPTVYYTVDGGTQGAGAGTSTHEGNGQWSYAPAQAETNGNHVAFTMVLSGAISQTVNVYPVSFDPTDSADLGVTALTGHTPQTGDSYARIGANGAGLSAVPWNSSWDAEVQSECADAITAAAPANWSSMVISGAGAVDSLCQGFLDNVLTGNSAYIADNFSYFWSIYPTTTNTVDDVGGGSSLTLADIADAVWDEVQSGHTTAGTFGKYLDAEVSGVGGGSLTEAGIADAVWDELLSGHTTPNSAGDYLSNVDAPLTDRTLVAANYFDPANDDVSMGSILGTLLTESSAGRIAGNFDTFYDNADAQTTNTVDDVGAGAGGSFWSTTEQNQIRYRLGIDGTESAPSTNTDQNLSVDINAGQTVATVTTLTNLPSIPANWLTAAGIAASALDGKGDWNTTTPPTAASIRTEIDTNSTQLAAIVGDTNELQTNQGNWLTATGFSTHSAADVADAVWDEATSGHATAGTFGASVLVIGVSYTHTNDNTAATQPVTITKT